MVRVFEVTPVGAVGGVVGPGLLAVGELWFLLSVGDCYPYWLLFDGRCVVRYCNQYGCDGFGYVGGVKECSVEELGVFRAAVVRYLEDVGSVV